MPDQAPAFTTVNAYLLSDFPTSQAPSPNTAPPAGITVRSSVVVANSDGVVAMTGLADDTAYVFGDNTDGAGKWRYWWVRTPPPGVDSTYQRFGQQGAMGFAPYATFTPVALVASTGYFSKFVLADDLDITLMAFVVSVAAGSDDSCDAGIFDASLNRLASAGATTGKLNGTGVKTLPVVASLRRRTVYYAGFSVGAIGGTAAQVMHAAWASASTLSLFGTAVGVGEGFQKAGSHPLPASITSPTLGYGIALALRAA